MRNRLLALALEQLEYWPVAGRIMVYFQTFARQLRNELLDRGGLVQLDELSASAAAVHASRRFPKRQQFLAKLRIEQIKIEIILMKLADLLLVVKIMYRLLV